MADLEKSNDMPAVTTDSDTSPDRIPSEVKIVDNDRPVEDIQSRVSKPVVCSFIQEQMHKQQTAY